MKKYVFLMAVLMAACPKGKVVSPVHGDGGASDAATDAGDGGSDIDAGDGGNDGGPVDGGTDTVDGGAATVQVTGVIPGKSPVTGGDTALIVGSGFQQKLGGIDGGIEANTKLTFAGNPAIEFSVIDDNRIEATIPPGTVGPAAVTVVNPNGADTCKDVAGAPCFRYFAALAVSSITPSTGLTQGGDAVTVSGKGLGSDSVALIGGRALVNAVVNADAAGTGTITGLAPPGSKAGAVDVLVYNKDGLASLRRGFVYRDALQLVSVTPPVGTISGGTVVTLAGSGFVDGATVRFGGAAAANVAVLDDQHISVTTPAGVSAGAVDVTVTDALGTVTQKGGFVYGDSGHALLLQSALPSHAPTTGGHCSDVVPVCLSIVGTGLSATDLTVSVGGQAATIATVHSDNWIEVDVPANATGAADVQVRSASAGSGQSLAGAVLYYTPIVIGGATPSSAPAGVGASTSVTLNGSGFTSDTQVHIGTGLLSNVTLGVGGASLTGLVPSGSPGPADVRAERTLADGFVVRAILAGGFVYTAPLSVAQVAPGSGSQSGGNVVEIYGTGFTPGMSIAFGGAAAVIKSIESSFLLHARVPQGNAGLVDVSAQANLQSDTLHAGYSYYDPSNIMGGASGGPLRGTLNVTVLDGTYGTQDFGQPIPGCSVTINADELTGLTDVRGQAAFTGPSLVKSITVTVSKSGYAAASISHVFARDVTVWLTNLNGKPPSLSTAPPVPPACVSGHIYGFKLPAGVTLTPGTQRLEARVSASAPGLYSTRPFDILGLQAGDPQFERVTAEGGTYKMQVRFGGQAIYAVLGIVDSSTSDGHFTPLLMGIARGVQGTPGTLDSKTGDCKVTNVDLVLDMHRDETAPIQITSAPQSIAGTVQHECFATLDLGGDGVIPLASVITSNTAFKLERLPRVPGDAVFIVDAAGIASSQGLQAPYSFDLRRQEGDLSAGVVVGPMMGFPVQSTPAVNVPFTGTLGWTLDGQPADFASVNVLDVGSFPAKMVWDVVVPGTENAVLMPPSVVATLPHGSFYGWYVIAARSPRFDFDHFNYSQISGLNTWTSFSLGFGAFQTK